MYFLIILIVIAVDQIVKIAVDMNLSAGDTIPVIEGIFHITYVQNKGAAFSILSGQRIFLILLPIILIVVLTAFLKRYGKNAHFTMKLALSLLIAGGAGNLIDRVLRGFVVDMFDFRVWPVFNVADIAVCTGCVLLLIYVIFFDRKEKRE